MSSNDVEDLESKADKLAKNVEELKSELEKLKQEHAEHIKELKDEFAFENADKKGLYFTGLST